MLDHHPKNKTRSIIGLAIKEALLKLGPGELEIVVKRLESNFQCYLFDMLDNPTCLKQVLHYLYPNEFFKVLNLLEKELEGFSNDASIKHFIKYMKSPIY
ncbi:MAG: hypothetical protein ACRD9Q_10745 [Nitrososphaeraceae archaeon]